jgi:putative hydrolase of the HAD superfamily
MLENIIRNNCPSLDPLPTGVEAQLNHLPDIKAVLFDVYGTLFVSGSGDVGTAAATNTAEALAQALAASGYSGDLEQAGQAGTEKLKAEIIAWHKTGREAGIDFPEVDITRIWKKIIDGLLNSEILTAPGIELDMVLRLAMEYECRVNPVFPMPGSIDTIRQLREYGSVLGIVSNAQFYTPLLFPAFFDLSVEEAGFEPDGCIWSYKELEAKPSDVLFPKVGRFLREKHNIGLEETVYVGNDMLNDVYCAKNAGCQTVLFAGDKRSLRMRENDERCLAIKPDAVITSLVQLPEII